MLSLAAVLGVLAAAGLMVYVRFAPIDLKAMGEAQGSGQWLLLQPSGDGKVEVGPNSAKASVIVEHARAIELLAKLDAVAMATPRTSRVAGSIAEGRIAWVTRTAFWGFPDITMAKLEPIGLVIYARARYGTQDFGVNAARLRAWLGALGS